MDSLDIDVYVYKRKCWTTAVLWVLKFGEVEDRTNENQNPERKDGFCFTSKTSFFAGLGSLFGTFLVIF